MKKLNLFKKLRFYTAALSVAVLNLNVFGYSLRGICSPGFNCHGCPWATSACPIGVFAFGSAVKRLPFLALTSILLIGVAIGRLVCGFFCPFGFLQDLLNKLPIPKFKLPKFIRYFKYAALLLLVFLFPYLIGFEHSGYIKIDKSTIDKNDLGGIDVEVTIKNISDQTVKAPDIKVTYVDNESKKETYTNIKKHPDISISPGESLILPKISVPNNLSNSDLYVTSPQSSVSQTFPSKLYFCKICPKGALTASLPSKFGAETEGSMYSGAGWFSIKFIILYAFIILMLFSRRPFCRILCPLGALYGLTAKFSASTISIDKKACISCGACDKVCPVELDVVNEVGGSECIACGDCIKICPVNCIKRNIRFKTSCSEPDVDVVTE